MGEKIFDGIFNSLPWIGVAASIFWISDCIGEMEKNERINQHKFMESCRNDKIQEHKCILLWHNYRYDGAPKK